MKNLKRRTKLPINTREDILLGAKEIDRPSDIQLGRRYRVVEGYYAGKEGTAIDKETSSFGFVWVVLQQVDGEPVKARWSDLEPFS